MSGQLPIDRRRRSEFAPRLLEATKRLFSRAKAKLQQDSSRPPNVTDNETNMDKAVEQAFEERREEEPKK